MGPLDAPSDSLDALDSQNAQADSGSNSNSKSSQSAAADKQAESQISQSQCVTLAFDKDGQPTTATTVLGIEVPFTLHSHVLVKNDEYDTEERLGPLRVADHGMRAARGCGYEVTECRQFLFRKFTDDVDLHTLSLIPTYVGDVEAALAKGSQASPLQNSSHSSRGVCCFFSHTHRGFMYDVTVRRSRPPIRPRL